MTTPYGPEQHPYGQHPHQPPPQQQPYPPQQHYQPPHPPIPPPREPWYRKWAGALIVGGALAVLAIYGSVSLRDTPQAAPTATQNPAAPYRYTGPLLPPTTAAAPTAPAPTPPQVIEGKGDDVVTLTKTTGSLAILDFECTRCSRNTIVKTDGADALLVNTIGSYKGRHIIDAANGSATSSVEIKASGSWKLTVSEDMTTLRRTGTAAISGHGDDAVVIDSAATKAQLTNKGEQNFIVKIYSSTSTVLAVNTIGSYSGTVRASAPSIVLITSDGDWTLTPGS